MPAASRRSNELLATVPSRRGFFFGAATAGVAAAAITALPHLQAPEPLVAEVLPPPPENGGGYTASAHVQRYYKTARI